LAESEDHLARGGKSAHQQALSALVKMREREGAHLAKDLALRIGVMQKSVAQDPAKAGPHDGGELPQEPA
jgi:uncharacterized protein YicC (UPF0701 family)